MRNDTMRAYGDEPVSRDAFNGRMKAVRVLGGSASIRTARAWLIAELGYRADDFKGDFASSVWDALDNARSCFGLSVDVYAPWQSDAKFGIYEYEPDDKETWPKSVWRVPARYRHLWVVDYCLSTGGGEDGFLLVLSGNPYRDSV